MEEITVLYIEDDREDYILLNDPLEDVERVKFKLIWKQTYEEGMEAVLDEDKYDVCILDYKLLTENAIDILKAASENNCTKPIIFLTGQKNHNIDMEAMKFGASDYLLKDRINSKEVERSIRYSIERKRLEKRLREERETKSIILDVTSAGICLVDEETNCFIETNGSFLDMFGLDEREIKRAPLKEFLEIKRYERFIYNNGLLNQECKGGICPCIEQPIECQVETTKGRNIDCLMSCRLQEIKNGDTGRIRIITLVDISKQKRTEKKLIEAQNQLQAMIKEYGIENGDSGAITSLIDLELKKFKFAESVTA